MLTEKVDMKMNKQKKTGETVWTSYSPEDFKKLGTWTMFLGRGRN